MLKGTIMDKYYQCILRRSLKNAYVETITWIPESYIVEQKKFQMEDRDGTWRNDWVVIESFRSSSFNIEDFRNQRRIKDGLRS